MGWFQRYGIPGAYFCGLSIMWFAALYHCQFTEIVNSEHYVKIIAGVLAGSFLPGGYLLSVIGQIVYHCVPGFGIDTRARRVARIQFEAWPDRWLEYRQEAITVYQIITTTAFSLDQIKWLLEWMSRRMDMIVINTSLVLATIVTPFGIWLFPKIFGLSAQISQQWFLFVCVVSGIVFVTSSLSWVVLTKQLVRVETKVLSRMAESRL